METHRHDKNPDIVISIVIFLVSSLYFLSFYDYGVNIWDEGVPLSGALRVMNGERPNRDFLAYPPGRYFLYAWSLAMAGGSMAGPRIMMGFGGAIIAVFIYWVICPLMCRAYWLFPVIMYLLMPIPYYYRFFTGCLLVSICVMRACLMKIRWRSSIVIGIGAVCVVFFREEMGVILSGLVILILAGKSMLRKERMGWAWIPLGILGIGWTWKINYYGGLKRVIEFYQYVWGVAATGRSEMKLPWPNLFSVELWESGGFFGGFQSVMIWISGLVLVWSVFQYWLNYRGDTGYVSILVIAIIGFCLVMWRTGYGNLHRCFPPIAILATILVWDEARNAWVRFSKRALFIAIFGLLSLDSLIVNPASYDSIGIRSVYATHYKHPRMDIRVDDYVADLLRGTTSALEQLISDHDSLACFPFHTLWNFLTGALNPTPYEWLLPGMIPDLPSRTKMIRIFQENSPDVILYSDISFDDDPSRKFTRQYPELNLWMAREYYEWMKVDAFHILKKLPENAVHLLANTAMDNIVWAEGMITYSGDEIVDRTWKVLKNQGTCRIAAEVRADPMSVLKVGIRTEEPVSSVMFQVYWMTAHESITEISRLNLPMDGELSYEMIVFITEETPKEGQLVFEINQADQSVSYWVDPVVFKWPAITPHIDTSTGSL